MSMSECRVIGFPKVEDPRGNLTFIEANNHVDFDFKRVYYVYDVPGGTERGGHAHKDTNEILIAMSGSFDVVLHDGTVEQRFHLNRSHYGLYVPAMTWRSLENFSSGSVCLVLASECYSEADYYRERRDFLDATGSTPSGTLGATARLAA